MAKRGRPKKPEKRVSRTYCYTEQTLKTIEELVDHYKAEAPPYLHLNQRMVVEAIIHHAKRQKDAGELTIADLFSIPAGAASE